MTLATRITLVAALALTALAPSSSVAATPISLGPGQSPAIAVDPAGTAYVAWSGVESQNTTLRFCRLPRGATACDVTTVIAAEATSGTRPFVSVAGDTVRVVDHRYGYPSPRPFNADVLYTSQDGGRTFGAGVDVGVTAFDDAVSGPGNGISLVTDADTNGTIYQRVPTDGSSAGTARAVLSTSHLYSGSVGLVDAATPLVVFADLNGAAQFRRHTGTGDPNDVATWTPAKDIGPGAYMHLAGGPSGLFLKSFRTDGRLGVRRYADETFGPETIVPDSSGSGAHSHMTQDSAGRLHVLWPLIDGVGGQNLDYATSDDGVTWQKGTLTEDVGINALRTAVTGDHVGAAAWQTTAGGGADSQIHVIGFGPVPPSPPPPPPPPSLPLTPALPTTKTKTVRVPGATISFVTPGQCVARGGTYKVRLKWRRQRRKGNLFIKIRRTDFYVGAKRVRIDKRAPFVATLRVSVGATPGASVTLRARAFIKVRGRRSPTKSIRTTLRVCA